MTVKVSPPATAQTPSTPVPPPKRRPLAGLASRLFWVIALVTAFAAMLPTLIGGTALRQQLLPLARPGLPKDAAIGSVELGWFSPVVLRDISIPDLSGRPLLRISEVRTDRPLWELATTPGDIGRVSIDQLELAVIVRPDGSNLADLLQHLEQTTPGRSRPRARLECHNSQLSMVDLQGAVLLACNQIELLYDDLRQGDAPAQARIAAVTTAPTTAGRVDAAAEWRPAEAEAELIGPGTVQLKLQQWPLDPALLWLREPLHATGLAGQLSLNLDGRWSQFSTAGGDAELSLAIPEVDVTLQSADLAQPPRTLQTRDARWTVQGVYDGQTDHLQLTQSSFQSEWLNGELTGSLSDFRGALIYDLSGNLAAKLGFLPDLLPPEIQQEVELQGLETRRIRLLGSLRPGTPTGEQTGAAVLGLTADLVWNVLSAYGIRSEQGEARLAYAGNRIVVVPTHVPVNNGRVTAIPQVQLTEQGPILHFAGGPLLENVDFTPEMCRSWLRFVSPPMANATSIDGAFTLAVDAAAVPLADWPRSDLQGQLQIHSARVGPGPMMQQTLGSIQQIRGLAERRPIKALDPDAQWLTITDQDVEFFVREGRVEHRNLQLAAGPVLIDSRGSVGLADDTVDLLLAIRLPESWFANRPLLSGLTGDGLQIPIRGTLSQPQVDARPLLEFGRGIGLRAADGFLQRLRERREQQ
ncbi:MAG: hypothetical protein ACK5Q5_12275 [Planctomycetaceae bacterium]